MSLEQMDDLFGVTDLVKHKLEDDQLQSSQSEAKGDQGAETLVENVQKI